jgi:hypothetical protein
MLKIMPFVDIVKHLIKQSGNDFAGKLKYIDGSRPVTDEEYEEQQTRMSSGLVPDKYDLGTLIEERKRSHRHD